MICLSLYHPKRRDSGQGVGEARRCEPSNGEHLNISARIEVETEAARRTGHRLPKDGGETALASDEAGPFLILHSRVVPKWHWIRLGGSQPWVAAWVLLGLVRPGVLGFHFRGLSPSLGTGPLTGSLGQTQPGRGFFFGTSRSPQLC